MKEMTSVATTMMSDEEKAEMEREMNDGRPAAASPSVSAPPAGAAPTSPAAEAPPHGADGASGAVTPLPSPGEEPKHVAHKEKEKDKKKKLTPEQKQKLQELEDERRKNMEERINTLTDKLIERLRPFCHAKRPGDKDDPETQQFEAKVKREAEDMKPESFGVEVRLDPVESGFPADGFGAE